MYGVKQLINQQTMLSKFASTVSKKNRVLLSTQKQYQSSSLAQFQSQIQTYALQPKKAINEDDLKPNPLIQTILTKTNKGRTIAKQVTREAPMDKFEKQQRYDVFINKMMRLQRDQRNLKKKLDKATTQMRRSHIMFQNPLKQSLSIYNKMTFHGFNDEIMATCLENLYGVIMAMGNKPITYQDYDVFEMEQSWRMNKVAEDVKFGLTHESVFFSPFNMARSARALAEIGYKNTEIIQAWMNHLEEKLLEDGSTRYTSPPKFDDVVYGSMKNMIPRTYVFQGFQDNEEFEEHLQTLLMFQADEYKPSSPSRSAAHIEEQMGALMEAAKEVKELQTDQVAAIETLRQQFFKLQQTQEKHEFLKENQYMMYDMLELQELLVKGGFMDPEEALLGAAETTEEKMERASTIFYDVALNQHPELLSPQYDSFYQAATQNDPKNKPKVRETHNLLEIGYLSEILVGVAGQAQSYRRDALDKDYPNKFYEDLVMPEESRMDHYGVSLGEKYQQTHKTPYVHMEPCYLNGWTTFAKQSGRIIEEHWSRLVEEGASADAMIKGFRALSACKYEKRDERDKMTKKAIEFLKSGEELTIQGGIDGLHGLGGCAYTPKDYSKLVKLIIKSVDKLDKTKFTYQQKIDFLEGVAMNASKDAKILDCLSFKNVMALVDELVYEAIDNDLTHKQYHALNVVHQTCMHYGRPSFANKMLYSACQGIKQFQGRYMENASGKYDPLKDRVVAGLARGLSDVDLNMMEDREHFHNHVTDLRIKPDIMTGYKGDHLGIYVLNHRQHMHDTRTADGATAHMLALSNGVKPVCVAVDSVVQYDLQNFQMKMRDDFDINSLLGRDPKEVHPKAYTNFAQFCSKLTRNMNPDQLAGGFDSFIHDLAEFFKLKQRLDILHEPEQLLAANDELKVHLIKLLMLHDGNLSPHEQAQVQKACGQSSFSAIVNGLRQEINTQHAEWQKKQVAEPLNEAFDFQWRGTRLAVELPINDVNQKKAVAVELVSDKFKQIGEYHHYADWKQMMTETYDQFNLMEMKAQQQKDVKVNYDPVDFDRRVPKGIFPLPNRKRDVMEQPGQRDERPNHLNDQFAKFEQDPHAFMVKQELKLSKDLKELTPEVSMITNLQNIKHSLLADYSDKRICQDVLSQLTVTDQLITEHLNQQAAKQFSPNLPRDAQAFRDFMETVPKKHDAFSQFWMKEGVQHNRAQELYDQIKAKQLKMDANGIDALEDELLKLLMKIEKEDEDMIQVNTNMKQYTTITVDYKSLGALSQNMKTGNSSSLNNADYLLRERCLAESRLIKARLIYKIDQDEMLTPNEEKYLRAWQQAMAENKTLVYDCLVPEQPTSLTVIELSKIDLEVLNSLPRVHLDKQTHGHFQVSDIMLEMGQVFDNGTVRAVELTCLSETMKNDWQLGDEFNLVSRRNKEIDHVMERYEEVTYRSAGCFNERDQQTIKDMYLLGRGITTYDREFLQKDISSLDEFIQQTNGYDNRQQMLETWLARKERELKTRTNAATPELCQSDLTIYNQLEKTYRPAREKMVSTIADGNKKYKDMTGDDLHQLVEALCPRLNMFNREYPVYLPHVVRGIMEHPNLTRCDYATLDSYSRIFHLDWRGDKHIGNKDEHMATHPVYVDQRDQATLSAYHELTHESLTSALKAACQPYLPQLSKKILQK